MSVKVVVKYYANAEQMQRDMARRRERGYRVVGQPFFGPPGCRGIAYLLAVGVLPFITRAPAWMVTYERIEPVRKS